MQERGEPFVKSLDYMTETNLDMQPWIDARDAALRALDVNWAIDRGCSPEAAEAAMHKARYECLAIEPELRHASREWLETHGSTRMRGAPWPPIGELPE
jgi:hypothetical protein